MDAPLFYFHRIIYQSNRRKGKNLFEYCKKLVQILAYVNRFKYFCKLILYRKYIPLIKNG